MESTTAVQHGVCAAPGIMVVFVLFFMLVGLIVTGLTAWAYCRIFSKAGFSWALGLLMLVPIANIVLPFVLAFCEWPVHRDLRGLPQQTSPSG